MKKKVIKNSKYLAIMPLLLLTCLFSNAQRADRMARGGGLDNSRSVNQQRSGAFRDRNATINNQQQPVRSMPGINDNRAGRTFRDNNAAQPQVQRPSNVYGNQPRQQERFENRTSGRYDGSNRTVTVYNRNNGYYSGNRGRYYPQQKRYYPAPYRYAYSYPHYGQRYSSLSFNFNTIPFGGIGYRYYSGVFYRPYGSYFQVVPPPMGICINELPFGYSRFNIGEVPYYFYGNTFYRNYSNYYQVVEPPLGAKLPALPSGAEEVYINGERYFEDNGTYYMEELNENNERLYTVVGVNGRLDTDQVNRIIYTD
jgi:hypothetical protein